ncbi:hypothetical protein DFJ74DRAFT_663125 [Hyaloraphidium curvatum]|nr:hypothetical protein DFJ74DRAFT_663125 [Hyaloraphidium curvatum]
MAHNIAPLADQAIYRKEKRTGVQTQRPISRREDSLEDFLKDFSSAVALSATVQVSAGKARYIDDIPAGGELEKQLKKTAAEMGAPLPRSDSFKEKGKIEFKEAWPGQEHEIYKTSERELQAAAAEQEKKDSASVFSKAAESVVQTIARSIRPDPDGVSELPAGLLIADARHKREAIGRQQLNPSRAKAAWQKIRSNVNSPIQIYLDNRKMGSHIPMKPARDSALEPEREYVPKVDDRDAAFLAAIEKHEASKVAGGSSDGADAVSVAGSDETRVEGKKK